MDSEKLINSLEIKKESYVVIKRLAESVYVKHPWMLFFYLYWKFRMW